MFSVETEKWLKKKCKILTQSKQREFPGGLLRLDPAFVYAEPPSS